MGYREKDWRKSKQWEIHWQVGWEAQSSAGRIVRCTWADPKRGSRGEHECNWREFATCWTWGSGVTGFHYLWMYLICSSPFLLTVLFIKFSSAFRHSPVPTSLGRPSWGLFNLQPPLLPPVFLPITPFMCWLPVDHHVLLSQAANYSYVII